MLFLARHVSSNEYPYALIEPAHEQCGLARDPSFQLPVPHILEAMYTCRTLSGWLSFGYLVFQVAAAQPHFLSSAFAFSTRGRFRQHSYLVHVTNSIVCGRRSSHGLSSTVQSTAQVCELESRS